MVNRKDIIREIREQENLIIDKLEELGMPSKHDKNNRRSNEVMGLITDNLNQGFYDYTTRRIKEKLGVNPKSSLYTIMDKNHLKYRLSTLKKVYLELIGVETLGRVGKKEYIKNRARIVGKNAREDFRKENGIIPITSIKKNNLYSVLEIVVNDEIDQFDRTKTNERIIGEIEQLTYELKAKLPDHYMIDRAYGDSICEYMVAFYGSSTGELLDTLKGLGLKTNKSILKCMDKTHLIYRYVCLSVLYRYINKYKQDEFDLYLEKCKTIGHIAKNQFEKKEHADAYSSFIKYNKGKSTTINNLHITPKLTGENRKLKLEPISKTIKTGIVEYEQMSMFDVSKTRERK